MQRKISVSFLGAWVLGKKDDEKLPVARFVDAIKKSFACVVLYATHTDCEIIVQAEKYSNEVIKARVLELIKNLFKTEDLSFLRECAVVDYKERSTLVSTDFLMDEETEENLKE